MHLPKPTGGFRPLSLGEELLKGADYILTSRINKVLKSLDKHPPPMVPDEAFEAAQEAIKRALKSLDQELPEDRVQGMMALAEWINNAFGAPAEALGYELRKETMEEPAPALVRMMKVRFISASDLIKAWSRDKDGQAHMQTHRHAANILWQTRSRQWQADHQHAAHFWTTLEESRAIYTQQTRSRHTATSYYGVGWSYCAG